MASETLTVNTGQVNVFEGNTHLKQRDIRCCQLSLISMHIAIINVVGWENTADIYNMFSGDAGVRHNGGDPCSFHLF